MSGPKRVVVTGVGAVTPLGNGAGVFWEGLKAGQSGIRRITKFDPSNCSAQVAAEVPGVDFEQHFDKKDARKIEDFAKYAVMAAREACKQSGILESGLAREEIGCLQGVGIGGIGFIEEQAHVLKEKGARRVSPLLIPRIIANIAPGQTAIDLGLKGPSTCIVTACAAGTHAIGEGAYMIERGDAVAMVVGGSEAAICELAIAGFGNMTALCHDRNENPEQASRPFDATRSGFVMGEGAGMLVLEDYEHAKARGAQILAEIKGYGLSSDAHHITAPAEGGEGSARAMRMALRRAGLKPEEIHYINAHGTSTQLNDKYETQAVKTVFGEFASKIPMSSNKSMIGHLLGAAGAVEAIATIFTMRDSIIPPTINYTTADPECDLDYVPNVARTGKVDYAMSNSLGFGGHNCSVIIARTD